MALKECGIAVIKIVQKGAFRYPPAFYSLKRRIEVLYEVFYRPLLSPVSLNWSPSALSVAFPRVSATDLTELLKYNRLKTFIKL
jgi:hypothetical protein